MLQRGATYLGGIEHPRVHEIHIGVGNSIIPDHVGGSLDPLPASRLRPSEITCPRVRTAVPHHLLAALAETRCLDHDILERAAQRVDR